METITDLHCHLVDSYDMVMNRRIPLVGGRYFRGFYFNLSRGLEIEDSLVKRLLVHSFATGSNTLMGVVNFDDDRAERISEALKRVQLEGVQLVCNEPGFVRFKFSGEQGEAYAGYLSGQEIATDRGHVLVIGAREQIRERRLLEVLRRAKEDQGALVLGEHTLRDSCLLDVCNRIINKGGKLCLSEGDIEKHASYFDALCADGEKQRVLAERLNLPLYASSDSHAVVDIFRAHTIFSDLDFSSREKLIVSMGEKLRNKNCALVRGSNGVLESVRHAGSVAALHIGLKLGLFKRDYQ